VSARKAALGGTVLVVNAVIMAVEMLATRLLFPFYGNTVFVWSSVISIIIAGLFLGYMAGGLAAERVKDKGGLVFGELLAAGLLVMFVPTVGDALLFRVQAGAPALYPPLLPCFLVFGLPAGLMASIPPAVVGLWVEESGGASLASGIVSALAAFGSILGTLATTFYLIPEFGVRELFAGLGLCVGAMAAVAFWAGRGKKKGRAAAAAAALLVATGLASRVNAHPKRLLAADPVYFKDSMYQLVRVFEQAQPGRGLLRVMMLDSTHEGAMLMETREAVFEYTRAYKLFVNALPKDVPSRVLFIGGGAYTMPIKVAEGLPRASVEVAEIDPVVKDVGRRYFGAGEAGNLTTILADGRQALRGRNGVYDGIFIDAYQGVMAIPFHLTTREFFSRVRESLSPEGFVSLNVIGNLLEKEGFFCATVKTLKSEFPFVRAYGVSGTSASLQNIIIVAAPKPLRAADQWLQGTGFAPGLMAEQLPCASDLILTDNHAPVEWLVARYLR
jgi:spermidine synthase